MAWVILPSSEKPKKTRKPRAHPERDIETACTDILRWDGWRVVKTDLPRLRGLGVQEKGMADMLYIRYGCQSMIEDRAQNTTVMWIEWKAPKGRLSQDQADWIAAETARGALVLLAGADFPRTFEGFKAWYAKSGLQRKI